MQAGGRRFDPAWLHSRNPCVHAGFSAAGHTQALVARRGWKRFGSLLPRTCQLNPRRTCCTTQEGAAREWCRWPDLAERKSGGEARAETRTSSPSPKSSVVRDGFAIVPVEMGDVRAAIGPARRCELKRACCVRRRVSVLLDFVPSVSPQGEAGGGEAAAKAPRWIKHDRGQSEPLQRRTRTAPVQTAAIP